MISTSPIMNAIFPAIFLLLFIIINLQITIGQPHDKVNFTPDIRLLCAD